MTSIVDVEVSASPHRTLNTIRGVLSEDDFLDASEEEILEGLKDAGVVAVKRIMFRKDGKETPSKHVILTFERHTLPETVKAGYLQCRIRPYVPNPQRCFRCQRFGHGSRSCRGKETCAKCGSQEHVADICEAAARCSNCSGPHPAYSRTCPLWRQEKEILSLKAKENITYLEAKKKLSFLSKGGYAEVVRRGPAPHLETRATQGQHAAPLGKGGPAIAVPALPFKTAAQAMLVSQAMRRPTVLPAHAAADSASCTAPQPHGGRCSFNVHPEAGDGTPRRPCLLEAGDSPASRPSRNLVSRYGCRPHRVSLRLPLRSLWTRVDPSPARKVSSLDLTPLFLPPVTLLASRKRL
ncbi:hypothetical protein ISCGN_003943 [Ixodes scapularis]